MECFCQYYYAVMKNNVVDQCLSNFNAHMIQGCAGKCSATGSITKILTRGV